MAQTVKNLPVMWETQIWSLGREDPLEKHSSTLPWRIPWTERRAWQAAESQRVRHDWQTNTYTPTSLKDNWNYRAFKSHSHRGHQFTQSQKWIKKNNKLVNQYKPSSRDSKRKKKQCWGSALCYCFCFVFLLWHFSFSLWCRESQNKNMWSLESI